MLMTQQVSAIANVLFSSTQQRLFTVLFGHPERTFYANELIGIANSGSGAVQRELKRLTQAGLVTVTHIGNQKHYRANTESPIFPELRGIILKTFGLADKIRHVLLPLQSAIAYAFIYGSVAKGEYRSRSDIDIMVVSDTLALADIYSVISPLELQFGRKMNITLYTNNEFAQRKQRVNPFLNKVLSGSIIPLIGDIHGNS